MGNESEKKEPNMWELVSQWIGNGKKMIFALLFLVLGVIIQICSDKTLSQIAFVFLSAGMMCVMNAIFSKAAKQNINLIIYLLVNVVVLELAINFSSMGFSQDTSSSNASMFDSSIGLICFGAAFVVDWIVHTILIKDAYGPKKIVQGFLLTALSLVAAAIAFVVPIFISCL